MIWRFAVAIAFAFFLSSQTSICRAQVQEILEARPGGVEKRFRMPIADIHHALSQQIVNDFERGTPLGEFLSCLNDRIVMKGERFRFVLDSAAFKEADPESEAMETRRIVIATFLKKPTAGTALRLALSTADYGGDCAIWCRTGEVLITTRDKADSMVHQALVSAEFKNRTLADALNECAEFTGVSIIVDNRELKKLQTRITASFPSIKVSTAARLLADMAGLRTVTVGTVIYVTSPANAASFPRDLPLSGWRISLRTTRAPFMQALRTEGHHAILDPRVERKARVSLTAKFINATDCGIVLRLLTDMVGLRPVVVDDVTYITSPANALRMQEEEQQRRREEDVRKLREKVKQKRNDPFSAAPCRPGCRTAAPRHVAYPPDAATSPRDTLLHRSCSPDWLVGRPTDVGWRQSQASVKPED